MSKDLSVRLHGEEIGILRLVNGKMEFTYSEKAKAPISLSLPLQKEPFKEKACRAFFGGLLPENPNMRELLAKKYNINIIGTMVNGKVSATIGPDVVFTAEHHILVMGSYKDVQKCFKL